MACTDIFSPSHAKIPEQVRVNVPGLTAQAAAQAKANAEGSVALENQLYPSLQPLRHDTFSALQRSLDNPMTVPPVTMAPFTNSPLLGDAYRRAQEELALGGTLAADTRALVANSAGGNTGTITARDLGILPTQLEQQRQGTASAIGQFQQQQNVIQQQAQNAVQQFNASLSGNIQAQNKANTMAISGLVTNLASPVAGLDPGQIASVKVGDLNALNAYNENKAAIRSQETQASHALWTGLAGTLITAGGALGGSQVGKIGATGGTGASGYGVSAGTGASGYGVSAGPSSGYGVSV